MDQLLMWHQTEKSVAHIMERNGALDALEEVQKNESIKVYEMSNSLLRKYFEPADD